MEQEIIDKYTIKENKHVIEYDENIGDIKGFNQFTYEKIIVGISDMKDNAFTSEQIAKKLEFLE